MYPIIHSFRKHAPVVFSKAYQAIYKEQLVIPPGEELSRDEVILNAQLVIDGLLTKTHHEALAEITGENVYSGTHKAIGILVGILFAEGQRLWREKMKYQKRSDEQEPVVVPSSSSRYDGIEQYGAGGAGGGEEQNLHYINNIYKDITILENKNQKMNTMRKSTSKVSSNELDQLLNRITDLEGQLKGEYNDSQPTLKSVSKKKSKKSGTKKTGLVSKYKWKREDFPFQSNQEEDCGYDDNDADDDDNDVRSSLSFGSYGREHPVFMHQVEKDFRSKSAHRKKRPSSAPGTRRVQAVSSRLYKIPVKSTALIPPINQQPMDTGPKLEFDPLTQTFDFQTGRRITLQQAHRMAEVCPLLHPILHPISHPIPRPISPPYIIPYNTPFTTPYIHHTL